ncbi:vesicle-fusing ATPase [Acrasis kona]|uniref:Vesicle-fusing ATPase n=1 Tax=Acrasis kona TaxID=1008807 RepID=A0AAW2ZBI0_9EUKA
MPVLSRSDLIVGNTPANNLVPSNYVYCSEDQYSSYPVFLKLLNDKGKSCVFVAQPHPKIPKGTIGLNRIQRTAAHASQGKPITCEVYEPNPEHVLTSLSFEIDFINPNNVVNSEVDCAELIEHMKSTYDTQVFIDGQKWVTDFEGNMLILTVTGMYVVDQKAIESGDVDAVESGTLSPDHGQIGEKTQLVAIKTKASSVKLVNVPAQTSSRGQVFTQKFTFEQLGIGGMDAQLNVVFRRAFASRIFPPDIIKKMGTKHVKGIILYGPPGTGKTLIARQIGKVLNTKEPKVVNGPEVLNKFVGASEENIRKLFQEAEEEYEEKGDDSELHLIIFDELDAICKQRGSTRDGTGVHDSIVNQLLSKIDGVKALNNVLIIGMTNRLDMLDEALVRPGRFEVKMEIGLPDEKGRAQILRIHTRNMVENNYLGQDVDIEHLAANTKNFSGAELEGLVREAQSFAFNRLIKDLSDHSQLDPTKLKITPVDFETALASTKPAFGVSTDEFEAYMHQGIITYGKKFEQLYSTCRSFVKEVETSKRSDLLSVLLEGEVGSGKTTLASHLVVGSGFPYVKIISSEQLVGYSEQGICNHMTKIFNDAYKSPMSIIILDSIERLIQYVHIGYRFSNIILQAILVLTKRMPPPGRKVLVIGTTSMKERMRELELVSAFNVTLHVPLLSDRNDIKKVFVESGCFDLKRDANVIEQCAKAVPSQIPIKKLLLVTEMAASRTDLDDDETAANGDDVTRIVTLEKFNQSLLDCGVEEDY